MAKFQPRFQNQAALKNITEVARARRIFEGRIFRALSGFFLRKSNFGSIPCFGRGNGYYCVRMGSPHCTNGHTAHTNA